MSSELMFIGTVLTALVACHSVICSAAKDVSFDENYAVINGYDQVKFLNQEKSELQLSLDRNSGAGFGSKVKYGSGFFQISLKLPPNDSAGVVTTFYLHSGTDSHDELDMEFLGNREGKPIVLQTNVFANGVGNREQKITLWFDPTANYHTYRILWNPHQIVFFVDHIPIRVYKNNTGIGVGYPTQPMQVLASVWDGDDWATDGGKLKVDWSHAPFTAKYKGFKVYGCGSTTNVVEGCFSLNSTTYWWNRMKFWKLEGVYEKYYQNVMKKHITYNYCTDKIRYPVPPPECSTNV
ncbi:OLC1v1000624C1 [Oldenlandia corymbosa var. corymbosa]|uniref:Xyloglucan endotransglucosylase/hydrolase n=1 Tax=Oldenlandia corymbosa var. corymbosa TaxID=529605 RepID=A0AAV1D3E9_OLDCO|nr:OLC1v1000624C1 [Oldenlandia corymbosa var. corymbosa]